MPEENILSQSNNEENPEKKKKGILSEEEINDLIKKALEGENSPDEAPDPEGEPSDQEIFEMAPDEYLNWLNKDYRTKTSGEERENEKNSAIEYWLDVVGEQIKKDPNQVPENVRLAYDTLIKQSAKARKKNQTSSPEVKKYALADLAEGKEGEYNILNLVENGRYKINEKEQEIYPPDEVDKSGLYGLTYVFTFKAPKESNKFYIKLVEPARYEIVDGKMTVTKKGRVEVSSKKISETPFESPPKISPEFIEKLKNNLKLQRGVEFSVERGNASEDKERKTNLVTSNILAKELEVTKREADDLITELEIAGIISPLNKNTGLRQVFWTNQELIEAKKAVKSEKKGKRKEDPIKAETNDIPPVPEEFLGKSDAKPEKDETADEETFTPKPNQASKTTKFPDKTRKDQEKSMPKTKPKIEPNTSQQIQSEKIKPQGELSTEKILSFRTESVAKIKEIKSKLTPLYNLPNLKSETVIQIMDLDTLIDRQSFTSININEEINSLGLRFDANELSKEKYFEELAKLSPKINEIFNELEKISEKVDILAQEIKNNPEKYLKEKTAKIENIGEDEEKEMPETKPDSPEEKKKFWRRHYRKALLGLGILTMAEIGGIAFNNWDKIREHLEKNDDAKKEESSRQPTSTEDKKFVLPEDKDTAFTNEDSIIAIQEDQIRAEQDARLKADSARIEAERKADSLEALIESQKAQQPKQAIQETPPSSEQIIKEDLPPPPPPPKPHPTPTLKSKQETLKKQLPQESSVAEQMLNKLNATPGYEKIKNTPLGQFIDTYITNYSDIRDLSDIRTSSQRTANRRKFAEQIQENFGPISSSERNLSIDDFFKSRAGLLEMSQTNPENETVPMGLNQPDKVEEITSSAGYERIKNERVGSFIQKYLHEINPNHPDNQTGQTAQKIAIAKKLALLNPIGQENMVTVEQFIQLRLNQK